MRFSWTGRSRAAVVTIVAALAVSACDLDSGGSGSPAESPGDTVIAAGFVQVLPAALVKSLTDISLTGVRALSEDEAVVRGPFFEAAETEVATVDHLTAEQVSSLRLKTAASPPPFGLEPPVRAGAGVEIFIAIVNNREATRVPDEDTHVVGAETVAATLHIGTQTAEVKVSSGSNVFVLGVPTGAPVSLEFLGVASREKPDSGGHTQSLDLRTGKRTADAIGLYYPVRRVELRDKIGPTSLGTAHGGKVSGLMVDTSLTIKSATLLPYTWTRGWAPPGKAWLVIEGDVGAGTVGYSASCPGIRPDGPATRSIAVVVNGRSVSGTAADWHYIDATSCMTVGQFVAVYAVPATTRSATVRVSMPKWVVSGGSTTTPMTVSVMSGSTSATGRITLPA